MNDKLIGIVIIDKPKGHSSFWVVDKLKKICNISKIGHTGTLDPLATGVLPICIGEATKAASFIMDGLKQYQVKAKLGERTDTLDSEGKITERSDIDFDHINSEIIKARLSEFSGDILQLPPMFSAIKKDGVPLYKIARQGGIVDRKTRKIQIKNLELLNYTPPYIEFKLECSKGTYVRSLIDDLGVSLGTFAHMVELKRLKTGLFTLKEAINLDGDVDINFIKEHLYTLEDTISKIMPVIEVNKELAKKIANGYQISFKELKERLNIVNELPEHGNIAVYSKNNEGEKKILSISKILAENCFDLLSATGESKVLKTVRVFNYDEWT